MSETLLQLPQNGFVAEENGQGSLITYENLLTELRKKGIMQDSEVVSQINIRDDGIVFYFKKREEMK